MPKKKKMDVKDVFNQDEDDNDGMGLGRKRKLVPLGKQFFHPFYIWFSNAENNFLCIMTMIYNRLWR